MYFKGEGEQWVYTETNHILAHSLSHYDVLWQTYRQSRGKINVRQCSTCIFSWLISIPQSTSIRFSFRY
jgi:hypothetical protein